jgi:rhodanese-related sulfurtransferase
MYKLRDWVDEARLMFTLSRNERAVEYLENHEHLIGNNIFENENAIHIIEKRIQYDKYGYVNFNKNAVNFLRNNRQYINYKILCGKEHGIEFVDELIKNNELDKIDWRELSRNPAAMHILNDPKYYTYLDWLYVVGNKNAAELIKNNFNLHILDACSYDLYANPHLIDVIEQNMEKINWNGLSENYNAIHILEKNLDKINWYCLSENHNAIHLLEKNLDKINDTSRFCWGLSGNKNAFKLLLQLKHKFVNQRDNEDEYNYPVNMIFEYFDYCEKNNVPFELVDQLSEFGCTEKHMEFLKHNHNYRYLSINENIFEYDYKRMRETRQSLPWYNDIIKHELAG